MGAPRALALCQNFGGALDFQAGRWQQSEEELRAAVALYRQVGSAAGESLSLQRLGVLLTARGELDEAHQALSDGLVVAERAAMRSHCLTRLHASLIRNRLAADDAEGIESCLADGIEAARRHGSCVTCNALLIPELVRAHIHLGDLDAAKEYCAKLSKTASDFESHVWSAMSAQCAGRVHLANGRRAKADDAFERARQAYQKADQPYEAARCLMLRSQCLPADEAEPLRAQAQAIFDRLGAAGVE